MCIPINIMFHNHKIRCRSIQWCWIAPFTTKIIIGTMVDIVIWINYESSCLFPNIPWLIDNGSAKNPTALINAYIIWSHIWCGVYCIQKIQDLCWRFRFVKQCPSMHSTTWSTEGFHTIEMRRYKIIVGAARYIFPVKITFDKSKTIIRLSLVTRTINKVRFRQ